MMSLVIFGSRDYAPSFDEIEESLVDLSSDLINVWKNGVVHVDEVVSGCSGKSDHAGERWAFMKGIRVRPFPADWDKFGKAAGPIRNKEMALVATAGIGFWKNESRGTANMCAHLTSMKKPVVLRTV